MASTHGDHKIYISEVRTGRVVQTLEGHPRTPWCLAFHPTLKNMVASGCLAGEVRVWDLHSGACEVWTNAHGSVIASLAFHPQDHLILIATCNELHFWDWRQGSDPFLTLTTSSEKEKVRYVKFDALGTKIITGISNIPPTRPPGNVLDRHASLLQPYAQRSLDSLPDTDAAAPATSLAARRSNLLSRVMSMYRTLETMDSDRSSPANDQPSTSAASSSDIDPLVAERTWERITSSPTRESTSGLAAADRPPPPPPLLLGDPHSTSLMSTFRRLHSLCTRLAQLMQEQQSAGLGGRVRLPASASLASSATEASTSLNDLLSRLQQSLQNMSTAAMTTSIAHEHILQVRQRVSEILERLVNVSGYRARLSNLRDQIYEVAERIAAGSEPELGGTHRWDLIHCLW